jgi:predicted RND superfamily exporter protein
LPPSPDLAARWVALLRRRALFVCGLAFAIFLAGLGAASRLSLRADLAELLPHDDPSLRELHDVVDRVGNRSTILVAIESDDPAANRRFAGALASQLTPLIGHELRSLDWRADATKAWFEHNRALYLSAAELTRIADDFESLLLSKENPAYVSFDDDPRADLDKMRADLEARAKAKDRFPSGYFEGEDGHLLVMIGWTLSSGTGDATGFHVRDAVRHAIAAADPARFGVKASITGDVESAIEEHDSLKSDIELVSLVCTLLVLGVIVAYFRSARAVVYVFLPTLTGVSVAFGIMALTIGYVNTNSAFLGSIILGNGINFGIILLARYQEERARGQDAEPAVAEAIRRTAGPTLVAALAAGVAYASLGITRFRGFQQFGFLGGIGMVLCWLATYSHGPALMLYGARFGRTARRTLVFPRGVVRMLLRRPRTSLAVSAAGTIAAIVAVHSVIAAPFDYDFRKLRNQRSETRGAGQLYRRVGPIFDSNITPLAVAILPTADDVAIFRKILLERDCEQAGTPAAECARRIDAGEATGGRIQDVRGAGQLLPTDQPARLAVIARLHDLTHKPSIENLEADDRKQVDALAPPDDLHAIGLADLPASLADPYRELDGTLGRVAAVYPVPGWNSWDGRELLAMNDELANVQLPDGTVVNAVGKGSIFGAMLDSILHDGPRASLLALGGVILLVVVFVRRLRGIALVVASLLVGVLWMAGASAALGLRLNFLNFVAVPVTFGIGVDYAINVYARLGREQPDSWAQALAQTGSAVALCSSTTIIGYSTLLIADNGALRSFGWVAGLGELGCLAAALIVVPAVFKLRSRQ